MKKISTILFILISLSGSGQTYTIAQFVVKYKNDSTVLSKANIVRDNRIKALEADNVAIKTQLANLQNKVDTDTLFLDSTLQYKNKLLGVTGGSGGANKKIIDSIVNVLAVNATDIKQLYTNDQQGAAALAKTNLTIDTVRKAMISYYQIGLTNNAKVNARIDSLIINTLPTDLTALWAAINANKDGLRATNEQVIILNLWADKIAALNFTFPHK